MDEHAFVGTYQKNGPLPIRCMPARKGHGRKLPRLKYAETRESNISVKASQFHTRNLQKFIRQDDANNIYEVLPILFKCLSTEPLHGIGNDKLGNNQIIPILILFSVILENVVSQTRNRLAVHLTRELYRPRRDAIDGGQLAGSIAVVIDFVCIGRGESRPDRKRQCAHQRLPASQGHSSHVFILAFSAPALMKKTRHRAQTGWRTFTSDRE